MTTALVLLEQAISLCKSRILHSSNYEDKVQYQEELEVLERRQRYLEGKKAQLE
jgi:hypothetical protein